MDKLRVGGPCVVKPRGGKEWRGAAGENYAPGMMHVLDSTGYRACCAVHTVFPAPFIPGDVVEHKDSPGLRELVDEAGETGCRTHGQDGETRFYYDRDFHDFDGDIAHLTLILPAQPAQEVL